MTPERRSYYLGSLDGLRFVAFLTVFIHHLPAPAAIKVFSLHGWVGIELFFVISAFLLFSLLEAEDRKAGRISIRNFYVRRVLRIYPLLVVYYAVVFVIGGGGTHVMAWIRMAATFASMDNVATWLWDYNRTVPAAGHLWTLSFEFHVYLLLPFAFLAWRKWGRRRFLWGLLAFEAVAFAARWWAVDSGVLYPGFHVIPYLRPESILLGLALAVAKPNWSPWWSLLAAVGAGFAFVTVAGNSALFVYVAAGVMVAALLDAGVRFRPLRVILSWRPCRYLGTISYGLYVFHIAAIWTVVKVLHVPALAGLANGPVIAAMSLALTIAAAAVSYRYLELPFLRIKRRFSAIDGRAETGQSTTARSPLTPDPV